jgi:L-threonylcarbamoyladenylate synthase
VPVGEGGRHALSPTIFRPAEMADPSVAFEAARQALRDGKLIGFPTDTVYGLGANASDPQAVADIYRAKGRPAEKAIPLLLGEVDVALALAAERRRELAALAEAFWPGPLTIVVPGAPEAAVAARAEDGTLALRVPDHPVALGLLRHCGEPVATSSANLSGQPAVTEAAAVLEHLGAWVDVLIDAACGRDAVPSTVVSLASPTARILRPGPISGEAIEATLRQEVAEWRP